MSKPVEVLFEDNHLLVLNKPAGLLTQPEGGRDNLEQRAKAYIKQKYNKPGAVFLHAAHRLDRVASGIVVFAKTSKALSRLNAAIREGQWKKTYLAWVSIAPKGEFKSKSEKGPGEKGASGHLEDFLKHADFRAVKVSPKDPDGKKCTLSYKVLKEIEDKEDEGKNYLLEIDLHTGRYHQIRAQLSLRGWPILGDIKYGGKKVEETGDMIALHHKKLRLMHPVGGRVIEVVADAPSYWL